MLMSPKASALLDELIPAEYNEGRDTPKHIFSLKQGVNLERDFEKITFVAKIRKKSI